ncbi:MAG TPA: hypothetical protein VFB23_00900 [Candidatus Acidoferrales bacterium]|nr:hypothetical protein [Candidatus Acidoferrales bacterium]
MAIPKFTLTTPQNVGDLNNPILIDVLAVTAISFNFDPALTGSSTPQMIVSIVLKHLPSGWSHNIVYKGNADGAAALAWFNSNFAQNLVTAVLNRLVADGKLPPGTIG